jgi:hypothetical protein
VPSSTKEAARIEGLQHTGMRRASISWAAGLPKFEASSKLLCPKHPVEVSVSWLVELHATPATGFDIHGLWTSADLPSGLVVFIAICKVGPGVVYQGPSLHLSPKNQRDEELTKPLLVLFVVFVLEQPSS